MKLLGNDRLQSVGEDVRLQQKGDQADDHDAILALDRALVAGGDEDLPEVVAACAERRGFLLALLLGWDAEGGLHVDLPCAEIHDEVDFQLLKVELAVLPLALDFDDADVHVAAAGNELVEDDVLHQVRLFGFAEVEPGVAQPHVRRVELLGIGQVFLAAHVVPLGLAEEIGLLEIVEVFLQRPVGRPGKALGTECQDELVRICQRADGGGKLVENTGRYQVVSEAVAFADVLEIDLGEKVLEVACADGVVLFQHGHRHSAPCHVPVDGLALFHSGDGEEFRERQRVERYFKAPVAEVRRDVLRQHARVRAGDVDVDLGFLHEGIEDVVEGDVCIGAVFLRDFGKLHAVGENLAAHLDLVDEDVCPFAVLRQAGDDVVEKGVGIAERGEFLVLEVDADDMASVDAGLSQVVREEVEEQIALSASADAGDDLDQTVVHAGLELLVLRDHRSALCVKVDYRLDFVKGLVYIV